MAKSNPTSSLYDISHRISFLREKKGITQERLAELVDVKTSTIGGYESGNNFPSLEVIIKLANVFKISTDELLGVKELKLPDIEQNYYENLLKNSVNLDGLSKKAIKLIISLVSFIREIENKKK